MPSLEKNKRQFTLIVAVLGVLNLVLIAYLLWPGTSPSAKQAHEEALQQQEDALKREVTPLRGIDEKLTQTRVDVKKFYEQKVPAQFSEISQHLEKLVQETGVTAQGIRYSQDKTDRDKNDLPDVQRVSIDTTVTGEYSKIARFINALEQDKFVFIINQISLNSSDAGNVVSLQIKFETFLKEI
jgi:Tfp pilus assembly protein PilO